MSKYERIIQDLQEFEDNINFIEYNLSLDSATIIRKLQHKNSLSRKCIDEKFKKYYKSKHGYKETLSTYIKRRKNNYNKFSRSKIKQVEEKYNADDFLEIAIRLSIIDKYKFCHIGMGKNQINIKSYNKQKILKAIFKDEIYLYFDLGSDHDYNINEIIRFNENHVLKSDADDLNTLFREHKFKYFFTDSVLKINGINYYKSRRNFAHDYLDELDRKGSRLNLDENLSNYRTILSNTKEFLNTVMAINNNLIDCEDKHVINSKKYNLTVSCEEDINIHYEKSVEEVRKNITSDQAIIFNEILNIENGMSKGTNLSNLYLAYDKRMYTTNHELHKDDLLYLLINGYIYMKQEVGNG